MILAPPIVLNNLKDIEIIEGAKLELSAQISNCYPIPTIEWFKDGKVIVQDSDSSTIIDSNKLVVNNSTQNEEGNYTIKISNELGVAESSCQVSVHGICDN